MIGPDPSLNPFEPGPDETLARDEPAASEPGQTGLDWTGQPAIRDASTGQPATGDATIGQPAADEAAADEPTTGELPRRQLPVPGFGTREPAFADLIHPGPDADAGSEMGPASTPGIDQESAAAAALRSALPAPAAATETGSPALDQADLRRGAGSPHEPGDAMLPSLRGPLFPAEADGQPPGPAPGVAIDPIGTPAGRPGLEPPHHVAGPSGPRRLEAYPPGPTQGTGWRIATKLRVLVAAPLVAVAGFAGLALAATAQQAQAAGSTRALAVTASQADVLVRQLQRERTAAVMVLTTTGGPTTLQRYQQQIQLTDAAAAAYGQARHQVHGPPAPVRTELDRVDSDLAGLAGLRRQVAAGQPVAASAATFQYRIAITDLLDLVANAAQVGQLAEVAHDLRAESALTKAVEAISQEQVDVVRALAVGPLTAAAQAEVVTAEAGYESSLAEFDQLAEASWRSWLDEALTGPQVLTAQHLINQVSRTTVGADLPVTAPSWVAVTGELADRIWAVASRVDQVVVQVATADRDRQVRLAIGEAAGVLVAVGGVVALGFWLGRPLIFRLRRLRDGARSLAYHALPDSVRRLRAEGLLGTPSPQEFAARQPVPGWGSGRDEISQVGEAFVEVHRVAIEIAAEQAVERARLGTIFVNLARRGDRMVGRLTRELDEAERDEQDPERLERLFALDHLVTLLGRTNRTLLVLGGQGSARVRDAEVPLRTVLQAALAQVERYTLVELDSLAQDVLIRREAVDDLVHLFAELLDNATSFAPANAATHVFTHRAGDRVVVQVADGGVGINPQKRADLNARLAAPPGLDVTSADAMGLTAVARIAALYRIGVELRPRPGRGTVAEVTLPPTLLRAGSGGPQLSLPGDPANAEPVAPAGSETVVRPRPVPGQRQSSPVRRVPGASLDPAVIGAGPSSPAVPEPRPTDEPAWSVSADLLDFSRSNPLTAADIVGDGSGPDSHDLPIFWAARNAWFAEGAGVEQGWSSPGDVGWQAAARSAAAADAAAVRPVDPAGHDETDPGVAEPSLDRTDSTDFLDSAGLGRDDPGNGAAPTAYSPAIDVPLALDEESSDGDLPAGLPRRVPMAWLVPGAPSMAEAESIDRRDPERVAATMAAYQRGVAASRAKRGIDPASLATATTTE